MKNGKKTNETLNVIADKFNSSLDEKLKLLNQNIDEKMSEFKLKFEAIEAAAKIENERLAADYKNKIIETEQKAQAQVTSKIEELDNKRKEELANEKKYVIEKSATEAINIIDQLETAIKFAEKIEAAKNFIPGFELVLKSFGQWLNKIGIEELPIKIGDKFDSSNMFAIDKINDETKPNDTIYSIDKKGYKLADRVIRFANVVVVVNHSNQIKEPNEQQKTAPVNKPPVATNTKPINATNEIISEEIIGNELIRRERDRTTGKIIVRKFIHKPRNAAPKVLKKVITSQLTQNQTSQTELKDAK